MLISPTIFSRTTPAVPTEVFDAYWKFAAERQEIFFRRYRGLSRELWTDDPILRTYKFTNAYRAADRASQYLIKNVIYSGEQGLDEVFFRIILFKIFNRIETWQMLLEKLGEIRYSDYRFEDYDRVLTEAKSAGKRIYSAAYIMPSGKNEFGSNLKHRNHLRLLEFMMKDELPTRLAEAKTMKAAFELIRSYPTVGDFLGYQFLTDLNYGDFLNFSEMEFVIPGPGCKGGIRKCFSSFGGYSEVNILMNVTEAQDEYFSRLGLEFKSLWGRKLQLIDCQNLFCEIDKYSRVAFPLVSTKKSRTKIKQHFRPNSDRFNYWFPPKWDINESLTNG